MLSVKECQDLELDIMHKFHLFCEKHDLKYIMVYGTLLGAVRHKGFVPWDNDIDIAMPRPYFEKFLEIAKTEPVAEHLYCAHYRTDPKYHYQVVRLCDDRTKVYAPYIREQPEKMGVWIDIFVIDGVWDHKFLHPIQHMKLRFNQFAQRGDLYGMPGTKGLKNKIKYLLHILFPCKNNQHEYAIDRETQKCSYETHDKVGIAIQRFPLFSFNKEDLENNRVLMPFEQYAFYGPKEWDKFLTFTFGDYMTPPPEEKRQTHDINAEYI